MLTVKSMVQVIVAFLAAFGLLTGEARADLCNPLASGLQAFASVQGNDAGCVSGGGSPVTNNAGSASAQAQALTYYGVNSASVSGNLPATQGTNDAAAWSIWKDTITITGGSGTGEVTFSTHLTGSFTDHTQTNYTLAVNDGAGGNFTGYTTSGIYSAEPGGSTSVAVNIVLPYTFTYDVAFTLTSWLDLSAHLDANCCGGREAMLPFFADFSHTAILDTVVLPQGALLSSASGSLYPAAAVPEPESYAMMLAGLVLMGFISRRRGRGATARTLDEVAAS